MTKLKYYLNRHHILKCLHFTLCRLIHFQLFRVVGKSPWWYFSWADIRGEFLWMGSIDQWTVRHCFRRWTLPSKACVPDRLSLESAEDVFPVWDVPSKHISWRTRLHLHSSQPWWRSIGIWVVFRALVTSSICRKDSPLGGVDVGRAQRWESSKRRRQQDVAWESRRVQQDCTENRKENFRLTVNRITI